MIIGCFIRALSFILFCMVSIDDFVKIVLVVSVAFAIVGLSLQLMRMISKLTEALEDSRKALKNFNNLSALALEDYVDARSAVKNVASEVIRVKGLISNPAGIFTELLDLVRKSSGRSRRKG